jgi:hypothetical protein
MMTLSRRLQGRRPRVLGQASTVYGFAHAGLKAEKRGCFFGGEDL